MDFTSYRRAFGDQIATSAPHLARVARSRTGSTQLLARAIAKAFLDEDLAVPATVVVASQQTEGRGRLGRHWASPSGGGAYLSRLLPLTAGFPLERLPIAVALGVCDVVDSRLERTGRTAGLKWPNDVQVGGRKIAGVLIETFGPTHEGESGSVRDGGADLGSEVPGRVALIGIGLNYALDAEYGVPNATSIVNELGQPVDEDEIRQSGADLGRLVGELAVAVERRLASLSQDDQDASLMTEYAERSVHRIGDRLEWCSGQQTISGRFSGFDDKGHLCLTVEPAAEDSTGGGSGGDSSGRTLVISAGEVIEGATK